MARIAYLCRTLALMMPVTWAAQSAQSDLPLSECRRLSEGYYECAYRSDALGASAKYTLQFPRGYDASRGDWPVVLFLHGAGRHSRTLWDHPATRAALANSRAVIILPDGGNSWWLDSQQAGNYASFPIELLQRLEVPLGLTREPAGRACAGWSMGGYGSIRLVESHPLLFGAWAGILPLLDFPNPGYPPGQNHSVPAVFGDASRWPSLNPMSRVEKLSGKRIWFVTASHAFERAMNETFSTRLRELRIAHSFRVVPGGHQFDVVAGQLDPLIQWLNSTLGSKPQ